MKFAIKCQEPLDISPAVYFSLNFFKSLDVDASKVGHALSHRKRLNTFTDLVDVYAFLTVNFGHPGSAVRSESNQALGLQDPKCLADWQSARSEPTSESLLHNSLAGGKLSADDF